MKVKLTYFKQNGKYYTEGSYETELPHLFQIFLEVRWLAILRVCPGLIVGHSNFIVLVGVPAHEHDHPHLVII